MTPSPTLFGRNLLVAASLMGALARAGTGHAVPPDIVPPEVQAAEAVSRAFRHATAVARPSVVSIRTMGPEGTPDAESTDGTGVVIDRAGTVLTNFHVVREAGAVFVRLADGREVLARETRGDPWSDLAVIRIDGAAGLEPAQFGDSDRAAIGDWVVAVGNAFGLGISVNPGTISCTQRKLPDSNMLFLETNAAVNPGSSGGPLLNLRGEIIGICEGGYSVHGGSDGIAFAIPANVVKFVVSELTTHGTVRWPYLGASFETLQPDVAAALGLPAGQVGAVVTHVAPERPAALAGLQVGDAITQFAGRPVRDALDLDLGLQRAPLERPVVVSLSRGKQELSREVQLQVRPPAVRREPAALPKTGLDQAPHVDRSWGLAVLDCKPEDHPDANSEELAQGIIVQNVEPGGAAWLAGMQQGSLITHVGTLPVTNVEEFKGVPEVQSHGKVVLLVRCDCCGGRFVVLDLARQAAYRQSKQLR